MHKKPVSHLRAIFYALTGFMVWVFSDTCAKLGGGMNLPPYTILAAAGLIGMAVMAGTAWPKGEIKKLWPRDPRQQLWRALIASSSTFINIIAVKHLPLTMFYIIIFTAPMFIALAGAVVLKERLSLAKMVAVIVGFAGVVAAIDPFGQHLEGDWIGYGAISLGVLVFVANTIWLRVMTQNESTQSLAFFTALVETVIGLVCLLVLRPEFNLLQGLPVFLGMGLFGLLGNVLNYMALKSTTASTVSQFHYTQIITGSVLGYLIWHEVPTWHFTVGAIIIIASGCFIAAQAHKTGKTASA